MFLTLFQFLTRLLTYQHLKHFSTYLVGEMERFEKRAYQPHKMRKKKTSWNIKTKCITDFLLTAGLREWRIILLITRWAHNSQRFALISKKIMRIGKFLFTRNRVCKHKEVHSKLHVCTNDLGKMCSSYISLFYKISNLHTLEII